MVGPLLLLKLLHSRKKCRSSNKDGGPSKTRSNKNKDYSTSCRICLKDGDIPIYGSDHNENISEALSTFCAINIDVDDGYPKQICSSCHSLLQGAILLRKTAQESECLLINSIKKRETYVNETYGNDSFGNDSIEYDDAPGEQKNYVCKRCDLYFESFKEYSEHKLTLEHETKRVVCPVCNKSFTANYYKKHMNIHEPDCPFVCDICGKKFIIQSHFSRHRLTHFFKLPFKCTLCPYRGRFRESLKMHMRSHTGEKPYPCPHCVMRFVSKSNLNKHMNIHKGEHDFKCESCGRGFYTKRNLERHIEVDHVGIKNHVCNLCGKAFGYRKQMMKHQLKVHKRQKLKSGRMPLYLQVEKMGVDPEA